MARPSPHSFATPDGCPSQTGDSRPGGVLLLRPLRCLGHQMLNDPSPGELSHRRPASELRASSCPCGWAYMQLRLGPQRFDACRQCS